MYKEARPRARRRATKTALPSAPPSGPPAKLCFRRSRPWAAFSPARPLPAASSGSLQYQPRPGHRPGLLIAARPPVSSSVGGGRDPSPTVQTQPCASFIRRPGVKTLAPHRSNTAAPAANKIDSAVLISAQCFFIRRRQKKSQEFFAKK